MGWAVIVEAALFTSQRSGIGEAGWAAKMSSKSAMIRGVAAWIRLLVDRGI
jgi:hypothetical protein